MKNQSKNPYFNVKVQKAINKLIADSYMAGHLFEFMVCAAGKEIRGQIYDMYLQNADEELSTHMKDLIDWAIEFDYDIPCSLTDMEKYADEDIVKLTKNVKKDGDIDYYVKRATDLLTNLIKTYDELIRSEDFVEFGDVYAIITRNYYDEIQKLENMSIFQYTNSITVEVA